MGTRTTRKQRIIRALTPRRIRRAQTRWRHRKQKVQKRYARFREVVRRDPTTTCGDCGRQVPQPKLKAHLARHEAQAAKAEAKAEGQRSRRVPTAAPPPRPRKAPADPPRPKCDGTCTNSDMGPDEATAQGLCWQCAGRRELVTNFGGKHVHVPCSACGSTGRASGQGKSRAGTAAGQGAPTSELGERRPTREEAGRKAMGWITLGTVCFAVFTVFGTGLWLVAVGAGAMAVGAGAYHYERTHGTSDHGSRSDRQATKQAAREAGCKSACMWSIRPADTCRCPCGGSTHGIGHRKKAAA